MCGIVAVVSFGVPVSATALASATRALGHRGPDGATEWLSDDGCAGLGHTRLGIVDLGASQPIESEDGRLRVVVNGEFYDFDRIRSELVARGHRLRTRTDSEIALHLYEERREQCVEQLRGEFAFIVWDSVEQRLFAARDRFGIKPLVYARRGDTLLLASEAKALFAAGVPAAWDQDAVFQAVHGCYDLERTLFEGVRHLPPGHTLAFSRAGLRVREYWDVDYPRARDLSADVDETACVPETRALLGESVRLRMRADVDVGYLLSGGLDSSLLLGIAAAEREAPRRAFTIAFDSDRYDESRAARETARHTGADLTVLRVSDVDLAAAFPDSVWHGEGLQYNAHAPARFLLSRAIRDAGYRAVMGGEGADEAFIGYGFTRSAATSTSGRWGRVARAPWALSRPLRGYERSIARTSPLLARASRFVGLPPWASARGSEWLETLRGVLAPEFAAAFQDRDPYRAFLRGIDVRRRVLGREPARKILYVWLRSIFVGYHLGADRLDMAHGVEVRLPYLDHPLFERVAQTPVSVLARDGRQKHLLREVGRPYVSEAVVEGRKQPFYAPPTAVEEGSALHELVQDTFRSAGAAAVPFLDQRSVVALLDRTQRLDAARRATVDPILMLAASLVILHERYRL